MPPLAPRWPRKLPVACAPRSSPHCSINSSGSRWQESRKTTAYAWSRKENAQLRPARQLADLLNGVVMLAETGLNDAKTRQQLDPATREAYLELLKSTDVSKIDRGDTKSVRLVFEITPKFLETARQVTPALAEPSPDSAPKKASRKRSPRS